MSNLIVLSPPKYHDKDQLEFDFDNETGLGYKKKPLSNENGCDTEPLPYILNLIEKEQLEDLTRDELKEILYEHFKDLFMEYYVEDPKSGHAYLTDYGLEPLLKNYKELSRTNTYEEKISVLDKILNVVHQRSDMASWFVDGGSDALSQISGYEGSEKMIDFNQYGSNIQTKKETTTT